MIDSPRSYRSSPLMKKKTGGGVAPLAPNETFDVVSSGNKENGGGARLCLLIFILF